MTLASSRRTTDPRLVEALRYGTAAVWIFFGLVSKVLCGFPRHQQIVGRVLGDDIARPVTLVVGGCEVLLGLWILSRRWPRTCAAVQTVALVTMNTLEISLAKDLLLAPVPMVCANAVFLGVGWYLALHSPREA